MNNLFKDKWFGILHHVVNKHEWLTGAQQCEDEQLNGPPKEPDGFEWQYFSRTEPAFRALRKILMAEIFETYTKFR